MKAMTPGAGKRYVILERSRRLKGRGSFGWRVIDNTELRVDTPAKAQATVEVLSEQLPNYQYAVAEIVACSE